MLAPDARRDGLTPDRLHLLVLLRSPHREDTQSVAIQQLHTSSQRSSRFMSAVLIDSSARQPSPQ